MVATGTRLSKHGIVYRATCHDCGKDRQHAGDSAYISYCRPCGNARVRERRKRRRSMATPTQAPEPTPKAVKPLKKPAPRVINRAYNNNADHSTGLSKRPPKAIDITLPVGSEMVSLLDELTQLAVFGSTREQVALALLRQAALREFDAWHHALAAVIPRLS